MSMYNTVVDLFCFLTMPLTFVFQNREIQTEFKDLNAAYATHSHIKKNYMDNVANTGASKIVLDASKLNWTNDIKNMNDKMSQFKVKFEAKEGMVGFVFTFVFCVACPSQEMHASLLCLTCCISFVIP